MKKLFAVLAIAGILVACNDAAEAPAIEEAPAQEAPATEPAPQDSTTVEEVAPQEAPATETEAAAQ